jgi:hypothetical protein
MLFAVAGCATLGSKDRLQVPVGTGYYSLQWQWPGEPLQMWQEVRWSQKAEQVKNREFVVSVLLENERLLLVALSPLGNELFRSELTASGHSFKGSDFLDEPWLALQVWADLQLSLWPLEAVNAHMSSSALQPENGRRNLRDDGELVWSSGVTMNTRGTIENKQRGYELMINTLQYDVLNNDEN